MLSFFYSFQIGLIAQPNILWIVSEDNSPFLGCYGDSLADTPNIDQLAEEGVLFQNAMATAPQCAPARFSIITGVYSNSMGTENMRSEYPIPDKVHFFPEFLRKAGYYTTNNSKKDYNTPDQPEAWDESSSKATYRNRSNNQPFFSVFNITASHESGIHNYLPENSLTHDPDKMILAPYHPDIPEMRHDYAQYYDNISEMDRRVGEIINQLEKDGLKEETIIFYYSDHGGILGRSKGYLFESGLRVPFIVYIPEKFKHLFSKDWDAGHRTDRPISFIDLAPSMLDLANIEIPKYMQGKSIVGGAKKNNRIYSYSFRGRSGESIDLSRSVRSHDYRYTLNLMPHRIYGQYNEYRWRAPSLKAWENAFKKGQLNKIQSAFFNKKPVEELYNISKDPHNIHNLANDATFTQILEEHRQACIEWMLEIRDVGIIPEGLLQRYMERGLIPAEVVRNPNFPYREVFDLALSTGQGNPQYLKKYLKLLKHEQPEIRYWAGTGILNLNISEPELIRSMTKMKKDTVAAVKLVFAEIFIQNDFIQDASDIIKEVLVKGNEIERVYALHLVEQLKLSERIKFKDIIISIEGDKDSYYDSHLAGILINNRKIFD
jgi:arylsulfatase A-like enzyme